MSRLYGPVFQNCYLTDDLDAELAYWTGTLGVGPFFVLPPRTFAALTVHGEERRTAEERAIIGAVALAFTGDTQIEIIVPGPAPNIYRDFLNAGGKGVHHLGIASRDFDIQYRRAVENGLPILMEGASPLARFAYIEADPTRPGTILELIEMDPRIEAVFDRVRAASVDWDGTDPIRPL